MNASIYTLGHSNLDTKQFQALLTEHHIETLVDIRSHPYSTRFPHFNEENLRALADKNGIVYHWAGKQLGGKRRKQSSSKHTSLAAEHRTFADYMDGRAFKQAMNQLISLASRTRLAIMCAEKSYQQCHRFMIADYLLLNGIDVLHITPNTNTQPHVLSPTARRESTDLIYDRQTTTPLNLH